MSVEQTTCEDLKAFERRLTEVIAYLRPQTIRWRILLVVVTVFTAVGAWQWLNDPLTSQISFMDSLLHHLLFTLSSLMLALLFLTGIHNRVVAPSILTRRTREVLADFNMSCDETGKLILKPRPSQHT
ncbi:Nuclear envelope phosphatase-regulatory subunit 1 [Orchesella cincta]|uniref:Transmembrane protein 188 n=1 Tax=Orchesella cincta TaxID=48709 RepID=A0A1D2MKT6_ORCCI|nr:Nuclear envelope phosphatase-regulatory subunit 1 [Orchesella cincta]